MSGHRPAWHGQHRDPAETTTLAVVDRGPERGVGLGVTVDPHDGPAETAGYALEPLEVEDLHRWLGAWLLAHREGRSLPEAFERLSEYVSARGGRVGLDPDIVHRLDGLTYELRLSDLRELVLLVELMLPLFASHARVLVDSLEGALGMARLMSETVTDWGIE